VFFDGAQQAGLPFTDDFNGPEPEGVGRYRINTRHGMRWSGADAFLRPALRRGQATLLTGAMASRVLFEGRRAVGICYHQDGVEHQARARRALARDLQTAAQNEELVLFYQLQTSLADGAICGAEALMRWKHPNRGMVSPVEFIPLAEETEAIIGMPPRCKILLLLDKMKACGASCRATLWAYTKIR
jgi:hypothetical protein